MPRRKFKLDESNYFSPEANLTYLDCSTYKNFVGTVARKGCECRALAIAKGEYITPKTEALLVGSYVDAYFDHSLAKFCSDNMTEIFTQASIKKFNSSGNVDDLVKFAAFKQADAMIERALKEPLFMKYVEGETQKILTAEIDAEYEVSYLVDGVVRIEKFEFKIYADKRKRELKKNGVTAKLKKTRKGVPIRVKLDSYDGHRITDLKTAASIGETYYAADLGERLNFAEYFGYVEQAYFYQTAVEQNYGKHLPFYLAVITKDKVGQIPHPRVAVIQIPDKLIEEKGKSIKANIHNVWSLLRGEIDPIPCGTCEWCNDNLPLEKVISLDELQVEV